MALFARRDAPSPRAALKRVERLARASFKVEKLTENDWMFSRRPNEACLLTVWAYREPDVEKPVRAAPVDGLVWDAAWSHQRRGLSAGALALAKAAAGRGSVEMTPGDGFKPAELFFYDRMYSPFEFDDDVAAQFLMGCADAIERVFKALRQDVRGLRDDGESSTA